MIKLSKTSKLGCYSWSLQAGDTCPGSYAQNGELVPACQGCYAKGGNYRFKNVKAPREHNQQDWKRDSWVSEMVDALRGHDRFRWFDSGDMYAVKLAEKILQVMERTPDVKHWLPTRMHKFPKFRPVLRQMEALPNVAVRRSSDAIDGSFGPEHGSTIVPSGETPDGVSICPAYTQEGRCGTCRNCWDKDVAVIGYVQHGQLMRKVWKLHKEGVG